MCLPPETVICDYLSIRICRNDTLLGFRSTKMEFFALRAGYLSRQNHGFMISKTDSFIVEIYMFYFLRTILDSQQSCEDGTEISPIPPAPTMHCCCSVAQLCLTL